MKKWVTMGILAGLIIGMVLMSGCTQDNYKYCSDNFPGTKYDPSSKMCEHYPTLTPVLTVVQTQNPIIGVWRLSYASGYDDRIRFNADNTFVESFYSISKKQTIFLYGTWSSLGSNSYRLDFTGIDMNRTYIFDPIRKVIYNAVFVNVLLSPYQGDVALTSTSARISQVTQISDTLNFHKGDVVVDESTDDFGWIILDTNPTTHQYEIDMINKNDDGSWGWRNYPVEEWTSQSFMEEGNPFVIAHLDPSKIINKYPSFEYWRTHRGT